MKEQCDVGGRHACACPEKVASPNFELYFDTDNYRIRRYLRPGTALYMVSFRMT
jgi:hypothetical protein